MEYKHLATKRQPEFSLLLYIEKLEQLCISVLSTHLFEEGSGAEEVGIPACDGLGEHLVGLLEVVLRLLHLIKKKHHTAAPVLD